MDNAPITQKWIHFYSRGPSSKLRLFCFHYAGGAAHIYRPWQPHIAADIELCAVQLPGRWDRMQEPLCRRMKPLIEGITTALEPWLDRPFAFFGHSFGALVEFEVCRALRRKHKPLPSHLFASAHTAPQLKKLESPYHVLSDEAFVQAINQRYSVLPHEILEDPEVRELFVGILRADLEALETYEYQTELPLNLPITVFGGLEDPIVKRSELQAWEVQTSKKFHLQLFPGDHFYLKNSELSLLQAIHYGLRAPPD